MLCVCQRNQLFLKSSKCFKKVLLRRNETSQCFVCQICRTVGSEVESVWSSENFDVKQKSCTGKRKFFFYETITNLNIYFSLIQ